jgi:hypothetical protein
VQRKTRVCLKGKPEVSMPCLCNRKQASTKPGGKGPHLHKNTKQREPNVALTPQPRAVQFSKRRQSGKRPVGNGADLVDLHLQGPAPANHRVRKRSHSHRSRPKITHTAQTPGPPSLISPIPPLLIRLPLLFVPA